MREGVSCRVLRRREEAGEDSCGLFPAAGLILKLLAACTGQPVELGLTVVLREAPLGGDGALLFEAEQSWIEGSVVEREQVATGLFNTASDTVAVKGAKGLNGLQDHKCESALPDV